MKAVRELLSAGAEVDARSKFDLTPLHLASMGGHSEIVKKLISRGADRYVQNISGQTPIDLTDDPEIHALFNPPVKSAF